MNQQQEDAIRPFVLSIAGFDPSGGAGILADIKTFEANGVYGFGATTAITYQNDREFEAVDWLSSEQIQQQIRVLLKRFPIRYFKIGLIKDAETFHQLLSFLYSEVKEPVIVFDPIIKASAGFTFHSTENNQWLPHFHRLCCITPNLPEAYALFGETDIHNKLFSLSSHYAVFLKGGHATEAISTDLLFSKQQVYPYANHRLPHGAKHGSGCVLSAALTAQLAHGHELPQACKKANAYTYDFLRSNNTLLGYHLYQQKS